MTERKGLPQRGTPLLYVYSERDEMRERYQLMMMEWGGVEMEMTHVRICGESVDDK